MRFGKPLEDVQRIAAGAGLTVKRTGGRYVLKGPHIDERFRRLAEVKSRVLQLGLALLRDTGPPVDPDRESPP